MLCLSLQDYDVKVVFPVLMDAIRSRYEIALKVCVLLLLFDWAVYHSIIMCICMRAYCL